MRTNIYNWLQVQECGHVVWLAAKVVSSAFQCSRPG